MKYKVRKSAAKLSWISVAVIALSFLAAFLPSSLSYAEDWPTYMHDNARSGVTSESLDIENLNNLCWVRTSPCPVRTAFSGPAPWDPLHYARTDLPPMRDFDSAFYVTAVGDSVFVGSSVTDSVDCLDINSGIEKWYYCTNGPVRFPPSYYNGRLYFGSDDGCVYCIDAHNGSFVWKYSPGGDTRLIGNNGKLIPTWPIRTGTAVQDGKVYFAASLHPWKLPYLCSLDANNGADLGPGLYKIELETPSGLDCCRNDDFLTPMGAILCSPSKIYLTQGTHAPHIYNREDGTHLGWFVADTADIHSWKNGGTFALLVSDVSPEQLVYGPADRWTLGYWNLREYESMDKIATTYDDGIRMVVSGPTTYVLTRTSLKAINRSSGSVMWTVPREHSFYVLIKAGNHIFVGGTKKVAAYDTEGNEVWSKTVTGKVRGLAAAGGRLFVSTTTGHLYAFGKTSLMGDFNEDGIVDIVDLAMFAEAFLKCTDPADTSCYKQ